MVIKFLQNLFQSNNKIQIKGVPAKLSRFGLRLPSCHSGLESQAYHLRFYQDENKQKEAGIGPLKNSDKLESYNL